MKGISPLVATVLLIAVTMTLAGIVAFWGSSFVRTSLPTENQTQSLQACTGGSIKLISSSYDNTSQVFSATIYNDGTQKLTLTNITFIYSTSADEKPIGKDISPAQVVVFSVNNVTSGYLNYIISTNCPNIYYRG